MAKIKVELIENFLVVWNSTEGSQLYKTEFYGKPLGIPKPKIPEFDVPLLLDLMEGLYLAEKGMITIYEGSGKRKVGLKKLKQKAKQLYEEFDEKYAVYRDLRDSRLIVTPGIKFGCDFAVYKYGPGVEHAPYMVSVKKAGSDISATEIVKAGRLATTVRKRF
ncbi:MAG: tRNA-intron lyase, partial [Crenarchaeota archaeon]|nr:tRNA-intron lyase [Thermoproteota archaeon]